MKALQSLYLLASDQEFRLLRGQGVQLEEIGHRRAADFPDVANVYPAGKSQGRAIGANDRGGPDAEERRRFARHVVEALEAEWAKAKDDRIILVAGPKMLGVLRDLMPKALAGQVAVDLAKDLVKLPLQDLPSHLEDVPGV
jgi:protein required for attachment to host cells